MKYLDESILSTYPSIFIADAVVLLMSIIVFLFVVLESIFTEGSFEVLSVHVVMYYMGMFVFGYHIGRYIFS